MGNSDNQSNQYLLDVLTALGSDASDVFSVNCENGLITAYKTSDYTDGFAYEEGMAYEAFIKRYVEENVIFEDKLTFLQVERVEQVNTALNMEDTFHFHFKSIKDGEKHYHLVKYVKIHSQSGPDSFLVVFALMDKSENKKRNAETDELTGVLNRQAFMRYAFRAMEDIPENQYDIVIVDIDRFKLINVMYGDRVGDDVLKYVAECFCEFCSADGIVGRLGADRFVCLMPRSECSDKAKIQKMLDEIQEKAPVDISLKAGIYEGVDRTLPISTLCERAMLAVRSIKGNAMLQVASYNGPISHKHLRKQSFEANFENAIKDKAFKVWYQPKFETKTKKVIGAEALVRWVAPDGSLTSPGEFIPVFEEDGLIVKLDEYVFRTACECIKEWLSKGAKCFPISINLSRASLEYEGTIPRYKKILDDIGLDIKYVPLEITESADIKDDTIKTLAADLKKAGFVVHMDDFGSGLSSLSSLNKLPIDVVKIDKGLIDYIGDKGGNELLKHAVSLAHFKKFEVIAEGVEYQEQYDFLNEIDCDMIQGYYFAKPMPYEDLIEFFKKMSTENRIG